MHVSPSQVSTYRACPRKWAYSRTRPRTSNKYAEFGSRTHTQIERWLLQHVPPDLSPEGQCAVAALAVCPPPGTDLAVEQQIDFLLEGVHYTGRIDLLHGYVPGCSVVVHDHKTTGDFRWAKTEADLFEDPQRVIYSFWASQALDVPEVTCRWGYYRRKPPAARVVEVRERREDIAQRMAVIHRSEGLAIAAAHGQPPEALPRNLSHCSAYGGCPYRAECHATLDPAALAVSALQRTDP